MPRSTPQFIRLVPLLLLSLVAASGCLRSQGRSVSAGAAADTRLDRARLLACLGAPAHAIYEPGRLAAPAAPGLSVQTFDQVTSRCGIVTRRYVAYVPPGLGARTTEPVLIVLHGQGASAEAMMTFQTRDTFDRLADARRFVVVYGNGLPTRFNFDGLSNSGRWGADDVGAVTTDDDVAYLDRVIADLGARGTIAGGNDVYLVGQSNGGGMALAAARARPDAYAGVAAFMPFVGFSPLAPPSLLDRRLRRVMFAYSLADPGLPPRYASTVLAPLARRWAAALDLSRNDVAAGTTIVGDLVAEGEGQALDAGAVRATRDSTARRIDRHAEARAFRELVFDRAGHFWPTRTPSDPEWVLRKFGLRNRDIEGAEETWSFFRD